MIIVVGGEMLITFFFCAFTNSIITNLRAKSN